MTQQTEELTVRSSMIRGALILAVFLILNFAVRPVVTYFLPEKGSYLRWGLISLVEVAGSIGAVMALYRAGLIPALREIRLLASLPKSLALGILFTLPMLFAFAVTGNLKPDPDLLNLTFSSGVAPVTEEILFRGFAFLLLYRYAGWHFWPAAIVPALLFGYGHLYQSADFVSATGIFAITAIGSVWFSWLLLRWDNLWVPIAVHALMNLWWDLWAVDETALGGWLANGSRLVVIGLSIVVTYYATGDISEEPDPGGN